MLNFKGKYVEDLCFWCKKHVYLFLQFCMKLALRQARSWCFPVFCTARNHISGQNHQTAGQQMDLLAVDMFSSLHLDGVKTYRCKLIWSIYIYIYTYENTLSVEL